MLKVFFDNFELTKIITVTSDFTALNGADFRPVFSDYKVISGGKFQYTTRNQKEIIIPFYAKYESVEQYDRLQRVLSVDSPKKLTFSHLPDREFYAVPSGDLDFEEVKFNGKGRIKFTVPSGVSTSTTTKKFPFVKNKGVLEARVVNNGTNPVSPNYRIKLGKESGFLGIISPYGVMQFGKVEEADGQQDIKNKLLSINNGNDFSNWSNFGIFHQDTNKKVVAEMGTIPDKGGWFGSLPENFQNNVNGHQFGACKELLLKEHSKDWYIWSRAWFETGKINQTGGLTLATISKENSFVAGIAIEKYDISGNTARINFMIGAEEGGTKIVKTINFVPSYMSSQNPYGEEAIEQNKNMFDIKKEADKITFFHFGTHYTFYAPHLKDVETSKVQFFVGQMIHRNTTDHFITRHYIKDFRMTKLNIPYWRDNPNRYPSGSEVLIDGEKGKIFVDNIIARDDEILGTEYFKIPTGETNIQLMTSSFSEVKEAYVEIKEEFN